MMLILDNILNEIDEEWDVPVEINHHYDMAIFNESMSSDINNHGHLLSVFFADEYKKVITYN